MLSRLIRRLRAEDGQGLVELALALPILLFVLFAIFDFGSAVKDWNSATSLANVGARYAAVGNLPGTSGDATCGSQTTIVLYVQCQAQHDYSLPTASGSPNNQFGLQGPVTVTVCSPASPASTAAGSPVEVKVTASYNWLPYTKLLGKGFASSTVTGSATMRLENTLPTGSGTIVPSFATCT